MFWRHWLGLTPRPSDLADAMLRELRRRGHADWTYVAENDELRNSRDGIIHLGNLFREFRSAPRAVRRALLDKYCTVAEAQTREVPKLWTLASRDLYPVVRSAFDAPLFDLIARAEFQTSRAYSTRPLGTTLCIRLVYDFGAGASYVDDELLATWGQTFDAALAVAIGNLRALPLPQWHAVAAGVFQLVSEHGYEESLVLLDKARGRVPVADAVFVACNRGMLLAAPADDDSALLRLLDAVEQCMGERPWPQSPEMLRAVDGELRPFEARAEPLRRGRELLMHELARVYDQQKSILERIHEADGTDVFVASCSLIRREGDADELSSWSVWAEGVATSLPRTDLVMVSREETEGGERPTLCVRWSDLVDVCGDRLAPETLQPPRFRTCGFPDDREWDRLATLSAALA